MEGFAAGLLYELRRRAPRKEDRPGLLRRTIQWLRADPVAAGAGGVWIQRPFRAESPFPDQHSPRVAEFEVVCQPPSYGDCAARVRPPAWAGRTGRVDPSLRAYPGRSEYSAGRAYQEFFLPESNTRR